MKKLLMSVMALTLVLSGCGNGNKEPQVEGNVLRVGMECNYTPFNWTEVNATDTNMPISAGGYCDGYDVQIAKEIAAQLDMDLEVVKMDWDSLIPSIGNGSIDLIIAGMTATPERQEEIDFTSAYYQSEMTMIVRKDGSFANAKTLEDFRGATIQGQLNTMYDTVIDEIPEVNHVQPLDNYPLLLASLLSGAVDGVTAETPVGEAMVAANPKTLALVKFEAGQGFNIDLSDTAVSIGLAKNSELTEKVQSALDNISEETRETMMKEAAGRQPVEE